MKYIDMETYPRRSHFEFFKSYAYPYVGMTAKMDVTGLVKAAKERDGSTFLACLYAAARAANSVPELRQRIIDSEIWEFPLCPTSHTVAKPNGTYGYCVLEAGRPFEEFLPKAIAAQQQCRQSGGIAEDESAIPCLFISSLPWISYTALVQPIPCPADSNVLISWGKYFEENKRILLPLTLLCHHGLVDGLHMSRFYEALDDELANFPN